MTSPRTFSLPQAVLARTELPLAAACAKAGVPVSNAWSTAEFFRIWTAAEALIDDRSAGLRFGEEGIAKGYGVASLVALHAPDFRSALASIARYKQLTCPERLEIDVEGSEVRVHYRWLEAEGTVPRLLVDMTMASLRALAARGTAGKATPIRAHLARRPVDAHLFERHFGCPIVFEAEHDAMIFERAALDMPFITADGCAFAQLLENLEAQLREGQGLLHLLGDLRIAVARQLSEGRPPSISAISRRLNLSSRTLQRRLGEERTSFQQQLTAVRHTIARRLLANTDLDPVAISMLVGFDEPNSFARAFRAWEQTTPQRWRQTQAATQA